MHQQRQCVCVSEEDVATLLTSILKIYTLFSIVKDKQHFNASHTAYSTAYKRTTSVPGKQFHFHMTVFSYQNTEERERKESMQQRKLGLGTHNSGCTFLTLTLAAKPGSGWYCYYTITG